MSYCLTCRTDHGSRACPAAPAQSGALALDATASSDHLATEAPAAADDPEIHPGSRIGDYEVTERIGTGGMGTVYAAIHPVIGKKVAIKVLKPALAHDPEIVQRFILEARAVNQIGHRNIVDIFGFGELPSGRHYFVMEFLPGRSLQARLAEGRPSLEASIDLLLAICDALAATHAEGIVHRDLKPDNIFLAESKAHEVTVKLLDFGVAKLTRHEAGVEQTRSGVPIGTPLYMAPEQCLGKAIDARADVYAMGGIIFELFTGRPPFPGRSYIDTVNAHLREAPPRPSELGEVPAPIEALILRCLEKAPEARFQTIGALREALVEAAIGLGVVLPTYSGAAGSIPLRMAPHASARRSSRWRGTLLIGGTLALATCALIAGWLVSRRGLKAATTELQVLSDPAGASIVLNGKPQALRTPGLFQVPRGSRVELRLERPGYRPYQTTVRTGPHEATRAVMATLHPEPPAVGSIEIRTNVRHASFTLDGQPVGKDDGTLSLEQIRPGHHVLTASAPHFDLYKQALELRPGEQARLDWKLVPTRRSRSATSPRGLPDAPDHDFRAP